MNEWQIYICEYLEKSTPITYLFYEKVDQRYNKYLIFSLIDIPNYLSFIFSISNWNQMEIRSKGNQKSGFDVECKTLQTNRAMLIWNPRSSL